MVKNGEKWWKMVKNFMENLVANLENFTIFHHFSNFPPILCTKIFIFKMVKNGEKWWKLFMENFTIFHHFSNGEKWWKLFMENFTIFHHFSPFFKFSPYSLHQNIYFQNGEKWWKMVKIVYGEFHHFSPFFKWWKMVKIVYGKFHHFSPFFTIFQIFPLFFAPKHIGWEFIYRHSCSFSPIYIGDIVTAFYISKQVDNICTT